jgi:cytochrome P450
VRSTLRFFESAIDQIISARRQLLAKQHKYPPKDILSFLLGALDPETGRHMSEAEIRSNVLTFIAAGHETTANALAWSLFLLSESPEWRKLVAAEVEHAFGPVKNLVERLAVTRAVIEEAIRLYPPIAAISRVAIDSDKVAGEDIRPGSMVVIAPYVLHRHRQLWQRPDVFDPSRFLGATRANINRFTYLPFGAGPRVCIGSTFALQEATIVLATIVKNFDFEMKPGHVVRPVLRVTLRPAGGLPMKITSRRSRAVDDPAASRPYFTYRNRRRTLIEERAVETATAAKCD